MHKITKSLLKTKNHYHRCSKLISLKPYTHRTQIIITWVFLMQANRLTVGFFSRSSALSKAQHVLYAHSRLNTKEKLARKNTTMHIMPRRAIVRGSRILSFLLLRCKVLGTFRITHRARQEHSRRDPSRTLVVETFEHLTY